MADYYISTDDGRVHHITDVTATPTIVDNDGVAATVYDGVYRDVMPFPNTGANQTTTYPFGPHWTLVPVMTGTTWTGGTVYGDDLAKNVAPRYLLVKKSMWKFVTAAGSYFFPIERVVGMSNTTPTY